VNNVLEIQHENEDLKLKLQELQNENAKMNKQVEVPLLDRMENLQKENDELKIEVEEVHREKMTRPKRKCVKEIKEKNVSENNDFQLPKQKKQKQDKVEKKVNVGIEEKCSRGGRGRRGGRQGRGGRGRRGGTGGRSEPKEEKLPKLKESPLFNIITPVQQKKMEHYFNDAFISNIAFNLDDRIMILGM
ncbi:hypothetical protein FRX31_005203, partial [Thalictrum thalictroides]